MTPENLQKVFAYTADSFLGLVRQVLDMAYPPDYKDLAARRCRFPVPASLVSRRLAFLFPGEVTFATSKAGKPPKAANEKCAKPCAERWQSTNSIRMRSCSRLVLSLSKQGVWVCEGVLLGAPDVV